MANTKKDLKNQNKLACELLTLTEKEAQQSKLNTAQYNLCKAITLVETLQDSTDTNVGINQKKFSSIADRIYIIGDCIKNEIEQARELIG